jgi:hypothetical protein
VIRVGVGVQDEMNRLRRQRADGGEEPIGGILTPGVDEHDALRTDESRDVATRPGNDVDLPLHRERFHLRLRDRRDVRHERHRGTREQARHFVASFARSSAISDPR